MKTCVALFDLTDIGKTLQSRGFLKGGPRSTYPRNGSPTCNLTLSPLRESGVAGSSPSTLTTSLAIPIPSSSSSNIPTTPLRTRARAPAAPCLGRSKDCSASLVRVLNDGNIYWVLGSQGYVKSSSTHDQSKATLVCLKSKKNRRRV